MKKTLFFILLLVFLSSCALIKSPGNTSEANVTFGDSVKVSRNDLEQAKKCVFKGFSRLKNCTLNKLEYNEDISNTEIQNRRKYDPNFFDTSDENIIVFTSEYKTGDDGPDLGLNQNCIYNDVWIITRADETSVWKLKGHGDGECWMESNQK